MSLAIHILGLFPNTFDTHFKSSLLGKADEKGLLKFCYHQLRDWSQDKAKHVDDKVYGGGSGMVFLPEVVCRAVRELKEKHRIQQVIFTSPRGSLLTPAKARSLSRSDSLLFLCGRYEGVDQRAIDLVVDEEISVGDYVLSGGELAACVIIDALCRYVPGVVGKNEAVAQDSFEYGLLEHPQFTRPEVFESIPVPPVLLSGNHGEISKWRREQALSVTWQRRPELLKKAKLTPSELESIKEMIHKKRDY